MQSLPLNLDQQVPYDVNISESLPMEFDLRNLNKARRIQYGQAQVESWIRRNRFIIMLAKGIWNHRSVEMRSAVSRFYIQMNTFSRLAAEGRPNMSMRYTPFNAPNAFAPCNAVHIMYHTLFQFLTTFSWSIRFVSSAFEVGDRWSTSIELISSVAACFELGGEIDWLVSAESFTHVNESAFTFAVAVP